MKEKIKEKFSGVFEFNNLLMTKSLAPGKKVYGEDLVKLGGMEFRAWNPYRSKLGAAIKNGLKNFPFQEGSNVLYLGSSEGTTVSHVSDIIGLKGKLFGVDISSRAMHKFIFLCESRKNIYPILADANQPQDYLEHLKGIRINVLFQDVSQSNQAEIFNKNAKRFLKKNDIGLLTIKARSIDSAQKPEKVIQKEIMELEKEFDLLETISLAPYEKDHAMLVGKRK